jgi:AcrR family transcriptional regulator
MSITALRQPPVETRQRIVDTAARLFREIGYQKTTVADIAKALRMSPANVYRFFDSKKAINEAVAERLMGEVEAALEAITRRPDPAARRLRDLAVCLNHMNAERYTANLRMHEMVEVAMTESWEVIHGHVERITAIYRRVIADGVAAGEFAVQDVDVAAGCARLALIRFCHPGLMVQCANEPGPTLEQMTEFVIAGLRCQRAC